MFSLSSPEHRESHATEKHRIHVAKIVFVGKLPVLECAECGESYTDIEALRRFERGVARHLAEKGPATGDTFRFMRKAIGLPAREVAHLLSTTPETVSRWEKGARTVDTCAWTTLATLVLDELDGRHEVRDRLLALKAKRPAKAGPVEVRV